MPYVPNTVIASQGSLPDWWVVDSTPNDESVTFLGQVLVRPEAHLGDPAYGIFFQGDPGFENNYNTYLELNHSDGTTVHYLDESQYVLTAATGSSQAKIELFEFDSGNTIQLGTQNGLSLFDDLAGFYFRVNPSNGLLIHSGTPPSAPSSGYLNIFYTETIGAPTVTFRGKDSNGDPFDHVITLT